MGNIWAEAHILTNLAVTQINQGAIEQAHQSIQQAIVLAHKMGDRDGLVSMFSNQANIALQLGHIQRGIQCCQNALVINKEIGDIRLEANTLHTLANAYYLQGRPHRGLKTLERTLALYKQINDPIGQASTLFSIGTVRLGWDEEDAAWALFEQTRSIVKERSFPSINSLCAAAMARIHARRGDSEQARTWLHQALALQPLLGKSYSAHLICQQGHVELLLNHPQGAQEAIDRVCALIEPEQRTPSSHVGNVLNALQRALEVNTTKGQTIPAPEGTVAVVFTHIPDTNTLWTALDDDFLSILKQHDEFILRNAHRHNGYVVKNSGDSFMLVFAETNHALAFARSTQRELLNSYWASDFSDEADKTMRFSIRMGLHTGPTERRANPLDGRFDYFGPAVNLASRITQLGQNNDILATATFVEDSNDEPTRWSALGPQRIKGFAHPFDLLKTSFVRAPSDASRG